MCSSNCSDCNCICTYTGVNFDFLGVSGGDNVDTVLVNIMSYMENSAIFSSVQGESGIVLYDGAEYTTPGTISNIPLDLQNMSDGDTYVLEFIIEPNYTNVIFKVLGLAVEFLSTTLSLILPYKVAITFSKDGVNLLGDYTVSSISTTGVSHESFEGKYTDATLFANNTLAVNITGTHGTQVSNISKVRNISLKFFKKLS